SWAATSTTPATVAQFCGSTSSGSSDTQRSTLLRCLSSVSFLRWCQYSPASHCSATPAWSSHCLLLARCRWLFGLTTCSLPVRFCFPASRSLHHSLPVLRLCSSSTGSERDG